MVLLAAFAALANEPSFELWTSTETQLTLSPETDPALRLHDVIPDRLRLYTELQAADDLGLQQLLARVGPLWNLQPWLQVATHGTMVARPTSEGAFGQEGRIELEPTFKVHLPLGLAAANRHRLELRLRPDLTFWRYRLRLGLSHPLGKSPVTPFLSDEVHWVTDGAGLWSYAQNRINAGFNLRLDGSTQLALAWIGRQVVDGVGRDREVIPENGLLISLVYQSAEDGLFQLNAD